MEDQELLEAIRLTILNNMIQYHSELGAQLALGATFGLVPPKEQDIDDDLLDYEYDDDNAESGEQGSLESENEDDNEASNEEWASSTEAKSDASDNENAVASAEAHLKKVKAAVLQKLVPYDVEELEKVYI